MNKGAIAAAIGTGGAVAAVSLPWDDIFRNILGAGGVPPALFLLVVCGLVAAVLYLVSRVSASEEARREENKACAEERNAVQEKRVEEVNRTVVALEKTATALAANTVAIDTRTATLNEAVQALSKMAQAQEDSRKYFSAAVVRLEENQAKMVKLLEKI